MAVPIPKILPTPKVNIRAVSRIGRELHHLLHGGWVDCPLRSRTARLLLILAVGIPAVALALQVTRVARAARFGSRLVPSAGPSPCYRRRRGLFIHSKADFNLHIPANAAWFAVCVALAMAPGPFRLPPRARLVHPPLC